MRNGQNKRMRNRNSGHSHNNNNNNNRRGQNPMTRVYESNGPEIKIRGTASHLAEKYVQLARDAQSAGDPVAAENYYQHAEHYFRIMAAIQAQQAQQAANNPQAQQQQPQNGQPNGNGQYRQPNGNGEQPYVAGAPQPAGPSFSLADGQQDVGEEVDAE